MKTEARSLLAWIDPWLDRRYHNEEFEVGDYVGYLGRKGIVLELEPVSRTNLVSSRMKVRWDDGSGEEWVYKRDIDFKDTTFKGPQLLNGPADPFIGHASLKRTADDVSLLSTSPTDETTTLPDNDIVETTPENKTTLLEGDEREQFTTDLGEVFRKNFRIDRKYTLEDNSEPGEGSLLGPKTPVPDFNEDITENGIEFKSAVNSILEKYGVDGIIDSGEFIDASYVCAQDGWDDNQDLFFVDDFHRAETPDAAGYESYYEATVEIKDASSGTEVAKKTLERYENGDY
jgi:hypothetical protein